MYHRGGKGGGTDHAVERESKVCHRGGEEGRAGQVERGESKRQAKQTTRTTD
jgi:hypothetical protein